jgi:hypothetical protein
MLLWSAAMLRIAGKAFVGKFVVGNLMAGILFHDRATLDGLQKFHPFPAGDATKGGTTIPNRIGTRRTSTASGRRSSGRDRGRLGRSTGRQEENPPSTGATGLIGRITIRIQPLSKVLTRIEIVKIKPSTICSIAIVVGSQLSKDGIILAIKRNSSGQIGIGRKRRW